MTPSGRRRAVAVAGVLGLFLMPPAVLLFVPALPSLLEQPKGFYWAGAEAADSSDRSDGGRPILLRSRPGADEVVAGSPRYAFPPSPHLPCYTGPVEPLRAAALRTGRIERLSLHRGPLAVARLSLSFDAMGGEATFIYHCGGAEARPLLSLSGGLLPGFGVRALLLVWTIWIALWLLVRRSRIVCAPAPAKPA